MYINSLGAFRPQFLMSGMMDSIECGTPFDQFVMSDPMERRGLYAHSGNLFGGGGSSTARPVISARDLDPLFPSGEPLPDAAPIHSIVQKHQLHDSLAQGDLYFWVQEGIGVFRVPNIYSLALLPVRAIDAFAPLLNVEEMNKWMPRLLKAEVIGGDNVSSNTLRRQFEMPGRSSVERNVYGLFQTTRPKFQGNFVFTYRHILNGGLQFQWRLDGAQKFATDEGKTMDTNNCSFTFLPVPGHPDQTYCAYHIRVEPDNAFMKSFVHLFMPNELAKELPAFMLSLVNRATDFRWTSRSQRDPLGVDLVGVANPSGFRYNVIRLSK